MDGQLDQIEDMLDMPPEKEEEPTQIENKTELDPVAKVEEDPKPTESAKPEPTESAKPEPVADDNYAMVMKRLDALAQENSELRSKISKPAASDALTELDLTDEEHEAALTSRAGMKKLMDRVYAKAKEDNLREIPDLVKDRVGASIQIYGKVKDFYDRNQHLVPYKSYVEKVVQGIQDANPAMDLDQLIAETERTFKSFSPEALPAEKGTPAFAKGGRAASRKPKPDLSQLEAEIADLIEV